jgi:phage gp29-like protein
MGRDGRIKGALKQRLSSLSALPMNFKPPQDTARAQKIADAVKDAWSKLVPAPIESRLRRWGIMLGIGIAQKIWDTSSDVWTLKLQPWHPSFYYWNWATRSIWVITQEGQVEIPEGGDENWFVYAPYGYYLGWLEGDIRALAVPWLMRAWARRDWARYNEVYGLGLIKAIVPAGASESDGSKDRFVDGLANRGSEPVIECERDENGKGYDFDLVEAQSTGWETFPKQIEDVDAEISITLLGQNLTTEGGRGGGGAYALGKVHQQVKAEIVRSDNESWSQAVRDQVLTDYTRFNFDAEELAPMPLREVDPEDKSQTADSLQKLSAAVKTFGDAKAPVDVRELLDQQGLPLLTQEQEKQLQKEAADRAAAAQAAFSQRAQPPAQQEPIEGDPEDDEDPEQLADRPKVPRGAKKGQRYADALTGAGAREGAKALEDELALLRHVIEQATSPEDLRERLVVVFEHLNPAELERVVEKAHMLAELAGRRAVLQDV